MEKFNKEYYRLKAKENYEKKRVKDNRLTRKENTLVQKEKIKALFTSSPKRHINTLTSNLINEYELRNITLKKSY